MPTQGGARDLRYAPPTSTGYITIDLERFRASQHAAALEEVFRTTAADRVADLDPNIRSIIDLSRITLPLSGGTSLEPIDHNSSAVVDGASAAQLLRILRAFSPDAPAASAGQIAGRNAQIFGDAAVVEVAPNVTVFGRQTELEALLSNPAYAVPAFVAPRFVETQRAMLPSSVLEAVMTLDGAEPMAGSPLGSLRGVVGASLDVGDRMELVVYGSLEHEVAAQEVVRRMEEFRRQAAALPLVMVFGAGPILERARITRDGATFRIVASMEADELRRILQQFSALVEMGRDEDENEEEPEPDASMI